LVHWHGPEHSKAACSTLPAGATCTHRWQKSAASAPTLSSSCMIKAAAVSFERLERLGIRVGTSRRAASGGLCRENGRPQVSIQSQAGRLTRVHAGAVSVGQLHGKRRPHSGVGPRAYSSFSPRWFMFTGKLFSQISSSRLTM